MAAKELKKLRYNQYKVFSVKDQRGKTLYGGVVGEGTDHMKIIPAGSYKNKSEVIKRAKQIIKSQNKYIDERKDFKMRTRKTTTKKTTTKKTTAKKTTAKSKSKKLTAAQKRMKEKGLVSVKVSVKGYDGTRYKKKATAKKSTAKKTTAKRKTTARKRTAGKQTKLF